MQDDRSGAGDSEAGAPPRRRAAARLRAGAARARPTSWATASRRARRTARRSPRSARIDRRVVALDADVKNSTFSEKFEKAHPDRFYQIVHRRAGDGRRGDGAGQPRRDSVSVDFACFLERASDFIRMAGISNLNIKLAGSHAGVSIGEDGPSQMALEDLAMMRGVPNCTVLYPCDARERRAAHGARGVHARARSTSARSRPKTPVIYDADETFVAGGSKTLRQSDARRRDRRRGRRDRVRGAEGARHAGQADGIAHSRDRRVLASSRSIATGSSPPAARRAAASSRSKITTRTAAWATP